jgi:hypothetical protein
MKRINILMASLVTFSLGAPSILEAATCCNAATQFYSCSPDNPVDSIATTDVNVCHDWATGLADATCFTWYPGAGGVCWRYRSPVSILFSNNGNDNSGTCYQTTACSGSSCNACNACASRDCAGNCGAAPATPYSAGACGTCGTTNVCSGACDGDHATCNGKTKCAAGGGSTSADGSAINTKICGTDFKNWVCGCAGWAQDGTSCDQGSAACGCGGITDRCTGACVGAVGAGTVDACGSCAAGSCACKSGLTCDANNICTVSGAGSTCGCGGSGTWNCDKTVCTGAKTNYLTCGAVCTSSCQCPTSAPTCDSTGHCAAYNHIGQDCAHCGGKYTNNCDLTCSPSDPAFYGSKCGCLGMGSQGCDLTTCTGDIQHTLACGASCTDDCQCPTGQTCRSEPSSGLKTCAIYNHKGQDCGHCGGKYSNNCDNTCSIPDPSGYGTACGCANTGTTACDGTCSADTPHTLTCGATCTATCQCPTGQTCDGTGHCNSKSHKGAACNCNPHCPTLCGGTFNNNCDDNCSGLTPADPYTMGESCGACSACTNVCDCGCTSNCDAGGTCCSGFCCPSGYTCGGTACQLPLLGPRSDFPSSTLPAGCPGTGS